MPQHIDRPEPRGQVIAAVLAIGAIYLALPRNVVVGPIWLLPTVIVVLLVPTVVSHRVGKQSLNRLLGFIINGITTVALIGSVILLVRLLPTHRESRTPLADECDRIRALVLAPGWRRTNSAAKTKKIWQHQFPFPTNASPTRRARGICVCALATALYRLSVHGLHAEFDIRADGRATTRAMGKGLGHDPNLHFA